MYQEQDCQELDRQIRSARLRYYIPAGILAAGGVVAFVLRYKWLTIALLILAGVILIFTADVLIAPLKAYRRHIRGALGSDQKEYTGVLKHLGDKAVEREGVMYYPFCLNVGDIDNEEDDRLLYFDANLDRPDWQLGDRLHVRSCARFVSFWEKAGEGE